MKTRLMLCVFALTALIGCSPEPENLAAGPEADSRTTTETAAAVVADAVYTNARIYTVNADQPWADALAVRDGEFLYVGDNAGAQALVGPDTTVTDLAGKFVLPGLHDTHLHFESFYTSVMLDGKMLKFPAGVDSIETLQQMLKEYAEMRIHHGLSKFVALAIPVF